MNNFRNLWTCWVRSNNQLSVQNRRDLQIPFRRCHPLLVQSRRVPVESRNSRHLLRQGIRVHIAAAQGTGVAIALENLVRQQFQAPVFAVVSQATSLVIAKRR